LSTDQHPFLIVSYRHYIQRVSFTGSVAEPILVSGLNNAVAIDFDWKEQYIYWSDITSKSSSINRQKMPSPSNDISSSTVPTKGRKEVRQRRSRQYIG
jgi:hypothetical protein